MARKDPFGEVKTLQGEVFRELELAALCALKWRAKAIFSNGIAHDPERDNQKFTLIADASIRPDREWNAIHRLRDVGVDTMYGWHSAKKALIR